MANISDVLGFGKIIFIPTYEFVPPLPEMSLLLFKEEDRGDIFPYRAVCIDLEMDACGNSEEEAWLNLKNSLLIYINMEKKVMNGLIIEAAKNITRTAFTDSKQKKEYFDIYQQAKLEYTMRYLDSGKIPDPIQEENKRLEKLKADKNESILKFTNTLELVA